MKFDLKMNRFRWMFSIGLLGLLGFASCSPRLKPRSRNEGKTDTLVIPKPDTLRVPTPGDLGPIKLMYGVPPARYEVMETPPERGSKKEN